MHECRLIGLTQPVIPEVKTANDLIAYCARVSNPTNQANSLTADRLIKYLLDHSHFSPFEMVHTVIEVKTTRDIGRQILRHKSFCFQEFSQRYAAVTNDMFTTSREVRLQDHKNRQNSIGTFDSELMTWWESEQHRVVLLAKEVYGEALDRGIAKECARAVLPEGLTRSTMYVAGTLRSWIHYTALRSGNGTQKEHAEIARDCFAIILEHFPVLKLLNQK